MSLEIIGYVYFSYRWCDTFIFCYKKMLEYSTLIVYVNYANVARRCLMFHWTLFLHVPQIITQLQLS